MQSSPDPGFVLIPSLSDPRARIPVAAKLLADGVYLIHYDNEDDKDWQFKQRALVKCRAEFHDGEEAMVAYEQVLP